MAEGQGNGAGARRHDYRTCALGAGMRVLVPVLDAQVLTHKAAAIRGRGSAIGAADVRCVDPERGATPPALPAGSRVVRSRWRYFEPTTSGTTAKLYPAVPEPQA